MFHGVKKKDMKKLTEQEMKKNEETLKKLKVIQTKILQIKAENKYSDKTMDFLIKAAKLMSDYPTIWSIRKKLMEQYITNNKIEDNHKFLKKDTQQIIPIMKENPKCYLLWYHRIWCLIKIMEIEIKQNIELNKCSLMEEIALCNKFLELDDRNFHVWNYRVNVLTLFHQFFSGQSFQKFIQNELDYTLTKIKKNFSNFSAWHYRAKLIPIYFSHSHILWNTQNALDFFNEDLELIKKAMYTDPKDQSPWNYHFWIVTNFSPIFIENIEITDNTVKIQYSNVFKIKSVVDLQGTNCSIKNTDEFSDCLEINIENNFESAEIKNKEIDSINVNFSNLTLVTNQICFTKENLTLPLVKLNKNAEGKIEYQIIMNNFEDFQKQFLLKQLNEINQLIIDSKDYFIEYAHLRLAQINHIFYKCTQYDIEAKADDYKNKEKQEYVLLKDKSTRLINLYSEFLKNI